jgi:hypothetical protein
MLRRLALLLSLVRVLPLLVSRKHRPPPANDCGGGVAPILDVRGGHVGRDGPPSPQNQHRIQSSDERIRKIVR